MIHHLTKIFAKSMVLRQTMNVPVNAFHTTSYNLFKVTQINK